MATDKGYFLPHTAPILDMGVEQTQELDDVWKIASLWIRPSNEQRYEELVTTFDRADKPYRCGPRRES